MFAFALRKGMKTLTHPLALPVAAARHPLTNVLLLRACLSGPSSQTRALEIFSVLLATSSVLTGTDKARVPLRAGLSGPTIRAKTLKFVSSVPTASSIVTGTLVTRYFPLALGPPETWLTLAAEEGRLKCTSGPADASVQTVHVVAV